MDLHPKQGKAFLSDQKITLVCSGIQGGKTTVGSLWLLRQISKFKGKGNNFIIGAPTYKILNQSTIPTFLKYASQFGEYKKGDQEFHLINGGIGYVRTATDPESAEGITDVRAIWLDEAGKCKYRFWVNLEGRAARTNAPILCTTTPYALNWPYKDLIKPMKQGERTDIAYYQWPSVDNPSFPREHYERQRKILDAVTFAMKYGGEHHRRLGLVHPLDEGQIIQPFQLPAGTVYYAGLDWGFTNPMALVIRAILPDCRDIQCSEFYESGIYPDDVMKIVKQKHQIYNFKAIVADPSDPGKISQLQRYGIPVLAGDNDVKAGIDDHNRILRSGKSFIFSSCHYTLDEYETYIWSEKDEDDDKDAKEIPIAKKNHAMDANRYISRYLVQTNRLFQDKPRVIVPYQEIPTASPTIHIAPWLKKSKKSYRPEEL